jgi:hypothetical protein
MRACAAETGEERDRPRRIGAELHAEQIPERDDLRRREERGSRTRFAPSAVAMVTPGEDAEVLDRHEAREREGEEAEEERDGGVDESARRPCRAARMTAAA